MISSWKWGIGETLACLLLLFALWVSIRFQPENHSLAGRLWLKAGTKWKGGKRGKGERYPRRDAMILFPRESKSKKILLLASFLRSHDG